MLRPVLAPAAVLCASAALASCSGVDSDANRFESLARHVADIQLEDARRSNSEPGRAALFRPAMGKAEPLKVQIMDPHDLWDARDGGLKGALGQIGERVNETAAPVMAEVAAEQAPFHLANPALMRPAIKREPAEVVLPAPQPDPGFDRATLQLGAYSSPEAARLAWSRVSTGAARQALSGLSPLYETVELDGRRFTRLRIAAPASAATEICQAVAASDPWCARRT